MRAPKAASGLVPGKSAPWATATPAQAETARPVGRRFHPRPSAATAQSRLLSKLDLEITPGRVPVAVIQEVARSGLRGRGGAGFPTGEEVRAVGAGPRYAVCSAAEGEPATFKDRLLLRTNPYQLLEGLAIAAYAVGAERAHVGLKETFTTEIQALTRVLGEMRDADALGGVAVEVVLGPDLYLFGEETELEEVIEGRPPLPRAARPFIQGCSPGPGRQPHAGQLRRDLGQRAPRPGRRPPLFTVCGEDWREGVFELPLGSPLRYLVEESAGGPPPGRASRGCRWRPSGGAPG